MTIIDDNKYIAENNYQQYIQRDVLANEVGEIEVDVWVAPTSNYWWLIIEPNSTANREEIFYHRTLWTSIFFYDVNRTWAKNHNNGSLITLNNAAGIYNFLDKDNENIFFWYKTSTTDLEIFWWYIVDALGAQFEISNTNTSTLSLTNNALNYIYVWTLDAWVSYELLSTTTQSNDDFVVLEVTKDASWLITLVNEWRQRWQWISTNGWAWSVTSVQWWTNITVDNTDPDNPIVNADTLTTADVTEAVDNNYITDAEKVIVWNTSWTNTWDQTISDATITTTDITTNNVTTLKHWFAPKLSWVVTDYLDWTWNFSTPPAGWATAIDWLTDWATDATSLFLWLGAGANDNWSNNNTWVWINTLNANISWVFNVAIWDWILPVNTWSYNTWFWSQTLTSNLWGQYNTWIWHQALYWLTEWDNNIWIWTATLSSNTLWNNNIWIWYTSGAYVADISESIIVWYNAQPLATAQTNQIVIGNNATWSGSNTTTIWNASTTNTYLEWDVSADNLSGTNTWDQDLSTYATKTWVETITNKRITNRVNTIASSATPTPNWDTTDQYIITALALWATVWAPTWTPTEWQKLIIRIKDNGTARTIAWNAIYKVWDTALPTTTVISKTMYLWFIYNSSDVKWDLVVYIDNL